MPTRRWSARRSGPARRCSSRSRSPSSRSSSRRSSRPSRRAATTASWSASTGASRRCWWTSSAPGACAPARCRSATTSTPGGWRRGAGTPAPRKAPAWWARGATSSTRSPGGSTTTRSRCSPRRPPPTRTTPPAPCCTPTARRRPARPQGAAAGHRRRQAGQAAQLPAHRAVARRQAARPPCPWRHRQGPAAGAGRLRAGRGRGAAHAGPARVPARHHAGHLRGRPQPAQPPPRAGDVHGTGHARGRPVPERGRGRMNALWYVRRLARMSPAEMVGRARDEAVKRRWRSRQVFDAAADPLEVPPACPPPATPLRPAAEIPEDARVRLKEAAEELLAGRWRVFARLREDMAPAPDWFLDARTGRRAPDRAYCFDIDHRDLATVGNVKYVWEPSRHQHLTVLAAAYHLSGDERYARCVAAQLRSWWSANPFLSGIHWTSGIELGVRLLSWVWVRRLLEGWDGAAALFEDDPDFLRQLHHHQEWLGRLPSHGSSANNHILAEMAGQFAASCAFPAFAQSDAWREQGAAALRRELPRQTFASGLNRELATEYHGFVLELGLAAALEGEAAGHPLGAAVWEILRRMVDALAAMVDVRLRSPRQNDADDGHGLLLDAPGYDRWASLLHTGAVLWGA